MHFDRQSFLRDIAVSQAPDPALEPMADPMPADTTLRQLRERVRMLDGKPLSVKTMAELTNINASSIRNWEYGRTIASMPVHRLAAVCRLLKVSIDQLAEACENSERLNASPDAEIKAQPIPTAEERAAGAKGKRRRGLIK